MSKLTGQLKRFLSFMKEAAGAPQKRVYRFGEYTLDCANRRVSKNDHELRCGAKTLDLLILLVSNAGRLVTRDEIRDSLWRDRTVEFDMAINNSIRDVRRLLGDSVKNPVYVKTAPKYGYVFIHQVSISDHRYRLLPGAAAAIGVIVLMAGLFVSLQHTQSLY
ncbi:MAG: winged helix-turn-helix domain-containing protein [Hyphococcus sp.]